METVKIDQFDGSIDLLINNHAKYRIQTSSPHLHRHHPMQYLQQDQPFNRSSRPRTAGSVDTAQDPDRPNSSIIRLHVQDRKADGTLQTSDDSNTCWPRSTAGGRPSMQQTHASSTGANSREFSAIGIRSDENESRAAQSLVTGSN